MVVEKLIEILSLQDPAAEVALFWDGAPRSDIESVYKEKAGRWTKEGRIVLVGEWDDYRKEIEKCSSMIYG